MYSSIVSPSTNEIEQALRFLDQKGIFDDSTREFQFNCIRDPNILSQPQLVSTRATNLLRTHEKIRFLVHLYKVTNQDVRDHFTPKELENHIFQDIGRDSRQFLLKILELPIWCWTCVPYVGA